MDKLVLENGEYEITHNPLTHWFECKRHGEDWLTIKPEDMNGGKMFIGMFFEMLEMKEEIKRLKESASQTFKFQLRFDGFASRLVTMSASNKEFAENIILSKLTHQEKRWLQGIDYCGIVE